MPVLPTFDYAIVRVVPRVERDEFVNAGVILYCRALDFLAARVALDRARLRALAPWLTADELTEIDRHLALVPRVCIGGPDAGPLGTLSPSERFHWLTQPSSSLIQTSPVHSGVSGDPQATLDHLLDTMVHLPPAGTAAPDSPPAPAP